MSDSEFYDSPSTDEDVEILKLLRQYHNQVVVPREEGESSNRGGFKHRYIPRDRFTANDSLMNDYFVDNAKYPPEYFKRRFRMSKRLLLRIVEGISNYSDTPIPDYVDYFREKVDGRGKLGFTTIQKVTSVIRQLAYGISPDAFDEYLQMAERTSREWANNDLNVLNSSPLFDEMLTGNAPEQAFTVNGVEYKSGYYLAYGIYPTWSSFVKGYTSEVDPKRVKFTRAQASARKDVERAFGVFQGRWHILQQPARAYKVNHIKRIMCTCILLHNMIQEDQKFNIAENEEYYVPVRNMQTTWIERCDIQRQKNKELRDREVHDNLRPNLVEHIWENRL